MALWDYTVILGIHRGSQSSFLKENQKRQQNEILGANQAFLAILEALACACCPMALE